MITSVWSSLELTQLALPTEWRQMLGPDYEAFKAAFLHPTPDLAATYPCPRQRGWFHRVIHHAQPSTFNPQPSTSPPRITAVCEHDPACPEIPLTVADITRWQLHWPKLARALCHALGLNAKYVDLGVCHTRQIGSWSADAVPVILTIQTDPYDFLCTVTALVAGLRHKFILLSPTNDLVDALILQHLAALGAAVFPLDTIVRLTPARTLVPAKSPGELFAAFAPQPKDAVAGDTARQLFALAKSLDSETTLRTAPPSTVLRLYCVENLDPPQIAKKLHCSRTIIYLRLELLRRKLGRHPSELRQYSTHLQRIQDSLSDPRAKRIRPHAAFDNDDDNQT